VGQDGVARETKQHLKGAKRRMQTGKLFLQRRGHYMKRGKGKSKRSEPPYVKNHTAGLSKNQRSCFSLRLFTGGAKLVMERGKTAETNDDLRWGDFFER